MNEKMPRTPFSTPLSGSARETELRLRNIFSGPKKRPPVLFLVLMFSVCIFCGNLVSCNVVEAEAPDAGPGSSQTDLPGPPEPASCSASVSKGVVLTLIPQGQTGTTPPGFEQIQVWSGDVLTQTITGDLVVQDGEHLFEGILRLNDALLDVRDVNFDGSDDFGIYCGATYNGPMYWFLWDEEDWNFRPGSFSSIDLTVDAEKKQLVDTWKDGYVGLDRYTYRFNDQGEQVLIGHQRIDAPASA